MVVAYTNGLLACIIMLVALTIYKLIKYHNTKDKYVLSLAVLFVCAIISCTSVWFTCLDIGKTNVEIAYIVYFISIDWLLILFFNFTREYTGTFKEKMSSQGVMIFVAVIDSVMIALNLRFGIVFDLQENYIDGIVHYNAINDFLFYIHLVFCYIIVLLILIVFVNKIICTSGFHRARYISVVIAFLTVIAMNGVSMLLNTSLDLSLYLYILLAILIDYMSSYYNPHNFVRHMLSIVSENMESGLVCFDEHGECIYTNKLINMVFGKHRVKANTKEWFIQWCGKRFVNEISNCIWSEVFVVNGQDRYYEIHFNKIYDGAGYYAGCYLLFYDKTYEKLAFAEEKFRSRHDAMTGLYNRESFYDEARTLLDLNPRGDYYVICSNIKDFKLINDVFGVETGDKVLIRLANELNNRCTSGAVCARLEADRFAVIMPKERFSEELFLEGMNSVASVIENSLYRLHIHFGIYEITDRSVSIATMCDRAFLAIDSIKSSYKDRMAYYGDTLRREYMNEQKVVGEFEHALASGQFCFFLQPQVDINGNVMGAEALARWNHPDRGIVSPGEFIEVLERTGFIYKLDMFVWENACQQLKKWKEQGYDDLYISVNISVKDFYYVNVYNTMTSLVTKYGVDPAKLNLEITETAFMTEPQKQLELINRLQDFGFKVEIDDFGSGYSSLNMLKEMNVDILKIDMNFLAVTENEARSQKIVNMVISLAKALNMVVITEGVETKEQVDYLTKAGCDLFQGYYFARPMALEKFEEKYMNNRKIDI